jgi:hypothetical protein
VSASSYRFIAVRLFLRLCQEVRWQMRLTITGVALGARSSIAWTNCAAQSGRIRGGNLAPPPKGLLIYVQLNSLPKGLSLFDSDGADFHITCSTLT